MPRIVALILFISQSLLCSAQSTAKPWTYWWWMGSAVDENSIEHQLEQFAQAGLGGVHIIPIYGVKGYENKFTPFLSDRWIALLDYTIATAKKHELGVDLSTGTGWPFGGPNVSLEETSKKFKIVDGKFESEAVKQKVKRAAPGGEGWVLDPFAPMFMKKYLQRFDSAFTLSHGVRSMYCDSYEVFGANWTGSFLDEFERRHGYKLQDHIAEFGDTARNVENMLIKIDYHRTLSELLYESMNVWASWSDNKKMMTRYQAHGSPGNLLDLYSLAKIPETESFGSSKFPIPGLRIDQDYNEQNFGRPNPLAMKFASSASTLGGKKLVSSETGTWLADHFIVALSQVKPQVDELFSAGINHIFYHGITYSPIEESYPGWLFYASTNYGPSSAIWKFLPQLNSYVERCQTVLQNSSPDNDVLLYFPIADIWSKAATSGGGVHQLDVHHTEKWLTNTSFGKAASELLQNGFSFDYVSDRQLMDFQAKDNVLTNGKSSFKLVIVPSCNYIPLKTLQKLYELAHKGIRVVFIGSFPKNSTGFLDHEASQRMLEKISRDMLSLKNVKITTSVLNVEGVRREKWSSKDLRFIRKKTKNGIAYFITNLGAEKFDQWITLSSTKKDVERFDAMLNTRALLRANKDGQIKLSLLPGQSCFLLPSGKAPEILTKDATIELTDAWKLTAGDGNPKLNFSSTLAGPKPWTVLCDSCEFFSGTMKYSSTATMPDNVDVTKSAIIQMENVSDAAEVFINGKMIGVAWCFPFQLAIPVDVLKPGVNNVEIHVTNAVSNYFRLYDQKHPEWKKFYDINFVNIQYKSYDGMKVKTIPAGLMGKVSIQFSAKK